MKTPSILFILYLAIGLSLKAFSQINLPTFRNITVEDGLTQNTVTDILQDYDGFMWFATEDGLNRYDGYNIKQFRQIPHGKQNIPVSRITDVQLFSDSILWIKTYYNSYCFSAYHKRFGFKSANQFFKNVTINDGELKGIFYDSSKNYWLFNHSENKHPSTQLIVINSDTTLVIKLPYSITPGKIVFFEDPQQNIWLSQSNSKLLKISVKNNIPEILAMDQLKGIDEIGNLPSGTLYVSNLSELIQINYNGQIIDTLFSLKSPGKINNIYIDSSGIIWGSAGKKSFFSIKHGNDSIYTIKKESYPNNACINSIIEDKEGNVWLGTTGEGIVIYFKKAGIFEQIGNTLSNPSSLAHPFIDKLFRDRDNNIWAGTIERGISIYIPSANKFTTFHNDPLDENSLSANIVRSICMDSKGHYWFATRGRGLSEYIPNENRFIHHFETSSFHYESLLFENDSILWIGTRNNGIFRYYIVKKNHYPFE